MSRRHLVLVLLLIAAFFGWAQAARANIQVTRFDDPAGPGNCPTDCSLRQAIAAANVDNNVIDLPAGTYTLSLPTPPLSQGGPGGTLAIGQDLTIIGHGSASQSTVITADYNTFDDRLITLNADAQFPPTLTLQNLSLVAGTSSGNGGAIDVFGMNLTLTDVTFDSNSATDGGALWLESGTVTGTGVTFSNNMTTDGLGAAARVDGGTFSLTNSTVVGGNHGGIENSSGTVTLTNVTIDGNAGGGLDSTSDASPNPTTITDTIVADGCINTFGLVSGGGNIYPSSTCDLTPAGTDQPDGTPGLASLADNGGPTETEALLSTSDAIDNGVACPSEDQRHFLRSDTCDIGAYAAGPQVSGTAGDSVTAEFFANVSLRDCPGTATIDWGDGAGPVSASVSCGQPGDFLPITVTGSHTYGAGGYYHLTGESDDGSQFAGGALIAAAPPTVGAPGVTGVTAATAVVGTTINPLGTETSYLVNYGTTTSYGQQTGSFDAGSGTTDQAVSATLQGLLPATTYHVQVVATNSAGTTASSDATFTTAAAAAAPPPAPALSPPGVGALSVTVVATASVVVSATVNPNGSPTFYHVEYGLTAAYGQQTGAVSAGSGTSAQAVSVTLSGLSPGTGYHVRVVAANPAGTGASSDATFTTTATGPPPPVQGQSLDVAPFSGNVLVNGQPLVAGQQIPFGSIIDATDGTVTLISIGPTGQLQAASFTGSVFQVVQAADGSTELILQGGDFSVCKSTVRRTAGLEVKPKPKPKAKAKEEEGAEDAAEGQYDGGAELVGQRHGPVHDQGPLCGGDGARDGVAYLRSLRRHQRHRQDGRRRRARPRHRQNDDPHRPRLLPRTTVMRRERHERSPSA